MAMRGVSGYHCNYGLTGTALVRDLLETLRSNKHLGRPGIKVWDPPYGRSIFATKRGCFHAKYLSLFEIVESAGIG